MRKLPKYSPYIFVLIAAVKTGFDSYVAVRAPRVFEAQEMFSSISSTRVFRLDANTLMTLGISSLVSAASIITAYFVCRYFYRKINADDDSTLSKFNRNHFTIMSFKYLGILLTSIISFYIFGNNPGIIVSSMMIIVNVIFTVTACILVFGYDENPKVKVKENTLLYGIIGLI